jgi:outer membrane protein
MRNLKILMNVQDSMNDYLLTDKLEMSIKEVDFENAESELLENNQNIKNQYIGLELQKSNTSFQKSFLYPTLSLQMGVNPSWSWIREIKDNAFDAETSNLVYYGNLNLRYTIFNNWKTKRAVEVSKIQEEIAHLNIESMEQTLSATLKNLIELYNIRTALTDISQENIVYAEQALNLASNRFDLGSINSIELATFQNNYQSTMLQHYENLFNKLDTYLEIYKMTGKLSLQYAN